MKPDALFRQLHEEKFPEPVELIQASLDGGALEVILVDHLQSDLVDVDDGVRVSCNLDVKNVKDCINGMLGK